VDCAAELPPAHALCAWLRGATSARDLIQLVAVSA
jgi:hypothetical protein